MVVVVVVVVVGSVVEHEGIGIHVEVVVEVQVEDYLGWVEGDVKGFEGVEEYDERSDGVIEVREVY